MPRGLVAIATALALAGAAVPFAGGPLAAMLAMSVSVAGGGGLYTLTTSDMLSRVPPSRVATVGGIAAAAQSVAQIATSPLIGLSVTATKGYTQIILLLTAWVLPGCVGWLLWRLPAPQEAEATSG
jgi:hypothetical protein